VAVTFYRQLFFLLIRGGGHKFVTPFWKRVGEIFATESVGGGD